MTRYRFMLIPIMIGLSLALSGCGTLQRKPPVNVQMVATCPLVTAPPQVPLLGFELRQIPADAPPTMFEQFMAALTPDDVKAILHDFSTLKQREDKWQSRADATNSCLKPPEPTKPAKRRLWPFGRKSQ